MALRDERREPLLVRDSGSEVTGTEGRARDDEPLVGQIAVAMAGAG